MTVGDRWWNPTAPTDTGGTDTGATGPLPVDPENDPTNPAYYAAKLQTPPWIVAGFPDYASYAANLRQKEELARGLQEKAINAPSRAAGVSAGITQAGENARFAVSNERQSEQFGLTNESNKAKLAAD